MHILVIEDDLKLLRLYTKVLRSAGYHVSQAATIHAAREMLAQHTFDVAIFDMTIGYHTGNELISQFPYLQSKGMRLIVISGQDKHKAACEAIGVDYYLKPISNAQLLAAVDSVTVRH